MNQCVNLHSPPEVSNRHPHGAVFVNVTKEVPEPQFVLVQIILSKDKISAQSQTEEGDGSRTSRMCMRVVQRVSSDLNDFHGINTFRWLLGNETSNSSILHFQTGVLETRDLQQMHKVVVDQNILFGRRR